jgi:hypothetical protein
MMIIYCPTVLALKVSAVLSATDFDTKNCICCNSAGSGIIVAKCLFVSSADWTPVLNLAMLAANCSNCAEEIVFLICLY